MILSDKSFIQLAYDTPLLITKRIVSAYTQKNISKLKQKAYLQTIQKNILSDEPLVSLASCGIKSLSFEWEKHYQDYKHKTSHIGRYLKKEVYVRESIAARLIIINSQLLSHGLHIYVRSGYRHPKIQKMRFLYAKEKFGLKYATSRFALKKDLVGTDSVFPHSTGGAVDIEIWQGKKRLEMGERGVPVGIFDLELLFSKKSKHSKTRHIILEKKLSKKIPSGNIPSHWKKYRDNRRLLYHTMRAGGFYFLFDEFWHWSLGDHLSGIAANLLNENPYQPWYGEIKFQSQ